jgi:hypothetical protein
MATIEQVVESAVKRAKQAASVNEALNAIRPVLEQPKFMFDPDKPLTRMNGEPIHAHKAFMDWITFGGTNFSYWIRFRYPDGAKTIRKYNDHYQPIPKDLEIKLGNGTDWTHLSSIATCEKWYKVFSWKKRSQRSYDLMSEKLIKQTEEIQLEAKKEQLNKVISNISELSMAIVNKQLRSKLKQMESNPDSVDPVRDIKALAELGISSHPLLKEAKSEEKAKTQLNIQNNYNFNKDIAQQIHGQIKDLE